MNHLDIPAASASGERVSSMRTHRDADGLMHWRLTTPEGRYSGVLRADTACGALRAQEQRLESGQVRLIVRQGDTVAVDVTADPLAIEACWQDLREAARLTREMPAVPAPVSPTPNRSGTAAPGRIRRIGSLLLVVLLGITLTLAVMIGIGLALGPDDPASESRTQPEGDSLWLPPER